MAQSNNLAPGMTGPTPPADGTPANVAAQMLFSSKTMPNPTPRRPDGHYEGFAVIPSDTVNLPNGVANALQVTGTGTIATLDPCGATVSFTSVAAGTTLRHQTSRVLATGTTATVVALY